MGSPVAVLERECRQFPGRERVLSGLAHSQRDGTYHEGAGVPQIDRQMTSNRELLCATLASYLWCEREPGGSAVFKGTLREADVAARALGMRLQVVHGGAAQARACRRSGAALSTH